MNNGKGSVVWLVTNDEGRPRGVYATGHDAQTDVDLEIQVSNTLDTLHTMYGLSKPFQTRWIVRNSPSTQFTAFEHQVQLATGHWLNSGWTVSSQKLR